MRNINKNLLNLLLEIIYVYVCKCLLDLVLSLTRMWYYSLNGKDQHGIKSHVKIQNPPRQ